MDNHNIFNRSLLHRRRNRAAAGWDNHNFLKVEAAKRLVDCLADMTRPFPMVLDLGCHKGELKVLLGNSTVVQCDMAENMQPDIVCDEEFLPFASDSFDAAASVLSLHHVNDLPGCLIQIREVLKPDGLFIAIMPGANTLTELRHSITGASAAHGFPLSPRISPFVEVRDAGALLQRAGFALPVVHSDTIIVSYENAPRLMEDLRGMGESNVLLEQHKAFTPRKHMVAICDYYHSHFANADGTIRATFEFVTLTGWKPHASQQQAAKRGSAEK